MRYLVFALILLCLAGCGGYELKNLAADPAYSALRTRLESEYAKQAKAIDFKIPEFADKPGEAGDGTALQGAYLL